MNTLDILDNGELALFIESLRLAGYDISTPEFFAAQDLIVALAAQGKLPKTLPPMKSLLMPILCHSPKEQEAFYQHFDDWVNQVEQIKPEKPRVTFLHAVWQETKQAIKNLKWFILLASLALILLSVFPQIFDIQEMGINDTPESASQKIRPIPLDSEGSPSTISTEPNLNLSENTGLTDKADFTEEQAYYQKEWVWVILLLLPLLAVLLWYFWQRYQAQPYLTRKSTSQTPNLKQFFTKNINEALFQSVGLARVAQQLRKHRPIATDYLDLKATIKDTIKAGGWFTPVTGIAKTIPEYLVLIDRTTFKDHQSHLIDALVNQLIAQGIFIARYYFDSDPRHCYPENDELPPLLLTELADHYPTHRLLIFSDGKGLIDPMTSDIVPWIEQFSVWTQKTFFTLEQAEQGGYQALLEKANFLVMPANENGLTTLAEQIKAETWQPDMPHPKKTTEPVSTFPSYFNELSQWWLKRHAPARAKITELLKQVQDFLGEEGYYWFSACAVYPELRWHLTVYLGYNLKIMDGNKLLTNDRLAKLARLPWFRYGYMPNWLRRRLVNDLSLEQDKAIRTELNVLWAKASDEPISDFKLEIAHEQKAQLSKLGEQLLSKWIQYSPKNRPLRDYVFLSFVPSKLAFNIPKNLRGLFTKLNIERYEHRWRFTGLTGLLMFAIVFFFIFSPFPISPTPDIELEQQKPALIIGNDEYLEYLRRKKTSTPVLNSRLALVIGNSKYEYAPLKTPVNDAEDITKALKKLGFHVFSVINADRHQMVEVFQQFEKRLSIEKGVGLFYFSGHGVGVSGENYLIPIDDAQIKQGSDVKSSPISVRKIVERMQAARDGINIIILDAGRDNPYSSISKNDWFSSGFQKVGLSSRNLVHLPITSETIIIFSGDIFESIIDDNERNSLFTKHLLKAIHTPSWTIEDVIKQVQKGVIRESNRKQIPWTISTLTRDFCLVSCEPTILTDKDNNTIPEDKDNDTISSSPSVVESKPTTIVDKDNDTIPDNEDNCPNNTPEEISKGVRQRGSKKGCSVDSDNDGVPDYKDSCQDTLFGIKVDEKGCATVAKEPSDYHTVERGETLYGIAVYYGQNYEDVARWNDILPPYYLSVGQKLRVSPPDLDSDGIPDDDLFI